MPSVRVEDILRETGLPFAACAFNNPPGETYAVYNEQITRRGADLVNCITEHDVTIEVYAYDFYDGEAVRAVARALFRVVEGPVGWKAWQDCERRRNSG